MLRTIIKTAIIITGLTGCRSTRPLATGDTISLSLENTSSVTLRDKAVTIRRAELKRVPTTGLYPLLLSGRDTLPVQLDDLDGDQQWDELFFVVNLSPNETRTFTLQWTGNKPSFVPRTAVRFGKRPNPATPVAAATSETVLRTDMPKKLGFQKYQTDGPTWENDKVGFRHYLDGRNAKDVFGKLTADLSPATVGINAKGAVEDNYHVMAPWGRDILAVGNSNGIGGIGLLRGDSVIRLGVTVDDTLSNVDRTDLRVLASGPVKSSVSFHYQGWNTGSGPLSLKETTTIWPGMYAYQNTVQLQGAKASDQLLVGIVQINATKPPEVVAVNDEWIALISHEKHAYNKEWWIGLALLVPATEYLGSMAAPKAGKLTSSYHARLKAGSKPLTYYAIAGWELSDKGFADATYFRNYVTDLARQLSAKVVVRIQ